MSDILTSLYEKILKNLRENRPSASDDQKSHASEIRSFLQLEAFPMRRFSKMEGWIIGDHGHFIHTSPSGMAYGHAEQIESGITLCEEMTCSINDPHYNDILQEKASALSNPTLLKSSSRAKAELSARLNSKHPIKTTPKPATALNAFEKEISGIVARTVIRHHPHWHCPLDAVDHKSPSLLVFFQNPINPILALNQLFLFHSRSPSCLLQFPSL